MTIGGNIMGDFDFIQMKKEKLQKQSKILTIVGGIFTAITLVLAIIFLTTYIKYATSTADGNDQLEVALRLVLAIIYCLVPGFITGVVSLILNLVAIKKSKKYLILDIVFAVLAFLAIAIFVVFLVINSIKNQQTPAETTQIFNAIKALSLIG